MQEEACTRQHVLTAMTAAHKPLFAEMIAQHPGLREELLAMDDPKPELRTLYELTGNILDINTILINRNELRSLNR